VFVGTSIDSGDCSCAKYRHTYYAGTEVEVPNTTPIFVISYANKDCDANGGVAEEYEAGTPGNHPEYDIKELWHCSQ